MKILFSRNTHDKDGNYRGDEYFGLPSSGKEQNEFARKELPFGVHTWVGSGPEYRMTFDEIYFSTKLLYEQHAADNMDSMPDDAEHTVDAFLEKLAFMVKHKLVVVHIE